MAGTAEQWREVYLRAVQPYVDDPVLAAGMLSRSGGVARMGVAKVSPLAGLIMGARAKKASGGLPTNVIVAVTSQRVHLFDYSPRGTGFKVKREVATWARRNMRVTTEDKMTATRLRVELVDSGQTVELDAMKGGGGFNDELIELLMASPAP
jgi:hypothetical protein